MKQFNQVVQEVAIPALSSTNPKGKPSPARKRFQRLLRMLAPHPRTILTLPIDHQRHVVWLFDNVAYQPVTDQQSPVEEEECQQTWKAHIVACVFDREHEHQGTSHYIARIADFVGIDGKFGEDPVIRQRITQRIRPLLYAVAPSRTLQIDMPSLTDGGGGGSDCTGRIQRFDVGPTNRNGIISQTVSIPRTTGRIPDGSVITSHLAGSDANSNNVVMQTRFAAPKGWLLISDIDDSIKITLTSDTVGILRTTFVNDPEPIAGMPEFYQYLQKELKPAWIYLSASPYNLYEFLRNFLHSYYPPGTLMLRQTSWKSDLGDWVKSFNTGTQAYKIQQLDKIHSWFPARKVICIGDSTQGDPEVYAEMYRRYQGWIRAIFIRKVTNVPRMSKGNSSERFRIAFRGIPGSVYSVFEQPGDLYEFVARLELEE